MAGNPIRLTDPVTSRRITDRASQAIADIRGATTLEELAEVHRGWKAFADAMSVCRAICDHIDGAVREVSVEIRAHQSANSRTGDRS